MKLGTIAEVCWIETAEGRGFYVRAEGAQSAGLATAILCQTIERMPEFNDEVRRAAEALVKAITGGGELPDMRFEMIRGERGLG